MTASALIVVTHLLGAGHLTRAAALGRALAQAGHSVTLVSGGMPAPLVDTSGMRFVQLPPVRAIDEDFRALADERGNPVGESLLARRRDRLLSTLGDANPDILVTELYPFGRRVLAVEFDALLDAARARRRTPLVVASIRDILVAPSRPEKIARAHAKLEECYDAVLVHGDPDLVPLDRSWPLPDDLAPKLHYTGYIDAEEAADTGRSKRHPPLDILVSGGSSDAALPLYRAALAAASLLHDRRIHLLAGRSVADAAFRELEVAAPSNAHVERARPDFRGLLGEAQLFVGLSGYNTAVDLFASGTPAILVPFERGGETEQRLRAECMATAGMALVLPERDLSAVSLAGAIRDAPVRRLRSPRPRPSLDGATESVRILQRLFARHECERPLIPAKAGIQDDKASGCSLDPGLRRDERRGSRVPALLDPALPKSLAEAITASLDQINDGGIRLLFWWRDDDAAEPSHALDRLVAAGERLRMALAIASSPGLASPALAQRLAAVSNIRVLVHGWRHVNHEPEESKSSEFGHSRALDEAERDAEAALFRAATLFGPQLLPVFVPPWNRTTPELTARLRDLGYAGWSGFGAPARLDRGLLRLDTHIDPIAWRGGRDLADEATLLAQWRRAVSFVGGSEAVIGLLSHHRVTTERVWAFMNDVVALLACHRAVEIPPLAKLWSTVPNRRRTSQANDAEPPEDFVTQVGLG